jgi:hypothetical protein
MTMTGHQIRVLLSAYRAAQRRAAQRALLVVAAALSPWLAIALVVRHVW